MCPLSVPWHDCAIMGETISSTVNHGDTNKVNYASPDKEHCSDDCSKDDTCAFWTFHEQAKLCTWKTAGTPTEPSDNMWFGAKDCSGLGMIMNKYLLNCKDSYYLEYVCYFQLMRLPRPIRTPSTATGRHGPYSLRRASTRRLETRCD